MMARSYVAYMPEIIKLRNRILEHEGFDFFDYSKTISSAWVRQANQEYQRVIRYSGDSSNTAPNTDEM